MVVGISCRGSLLWLYFCYWLVDDDNGRARRGVPRREWLGDCATQSVNGLTWIEANDG